MAYRPSITQVRFRLRKQLIDRLQRAAKAADRSLNDEVETRLEQSFVKEEIRALTTEDIKKAIAEQFAQSRAELNQATEDSRRGREKAKETKEG